MNLELKRISISVRLSEETTAFAADVWIDGELAGSAKNAGRGGATMVHIKDGALYQRAELHCAALVPTEYKKLTTGLEWAVDQLILNHLLAKDEAAFKRRLARLDKKETAVLGAKGLRAARFQAGEEWRWFGFKGDDHKATEGARQIAHKAGVLVDDVVVIS